MNKKLRWILLALTVVILIFASEMNKVQNYEEVPSARLDYIDEAGEKATENDLPLMGMYWKEASSEGKTASYKMIRSPLSSGESEALEEATHPVKIRLNKENSAVDLVYTLVPAEKSYQYSIVKAWPLAEIERVGVERETVMEEEVFSEIIPFTESTNQIHLDCQAGYLYRVTSFWGEDGEYTTHEFWIN